MEGSDETVSLYGLLEQKFGFKGKKAEGDEQTFFDVGSTFDQETLKTLPSEYIKEDISGKFLVSIEGITILAFEKNPKETSSTILLDLKNLIFHALRVTMHEQKRKRRLIMTMYTK